MSRVRVDEDIRPLSEFRAEVPHLYNSSMRADIWNVSDCLQGYRS